jgi:hypothetical protein
MHENRETSETPAVKPDSRSAGEGSGHTARVHVSEESHCGVVPMNHSNNDGASSAESEEGRPRLKENTLPSDTYPTLSGTARVLRVGECADERSVWPPYLREEPDALRSARPGPCGGHQATGVPTAIASQRKARWWLLITNLC